MRTIHITTRSSDIGGSHEAEVTEALKSLGPDQIISISHSVTTTGAAFGESYTYSTIIVYNDVS